MGDIKQFILDNILTVITSALGSGSFVLYILERNKRKIEERQLASDALKTMQDAYDKFTQDSLNRYSDIKNEVDDLKKKLSNVTSQLQQEKKKYNSLKDSYDKLKSSYDSLKRSFDEYKKENK